MLTDKTRARIAALRLSPTEQTAVLDIMQDEIAEALRPKGRALAKVVPPDWPPDYHRIFWELYPNRKAKAFAMKSLDRVAFSGKTQWEDLIRSLERYIDSEDVQRGFAKHPATWLNAECWHDEEGPKQVTGTKRGNPGFFEILTDMANDERDCHGRK